MPNPNQCPVVLLHGCGGSVAAAFEGPGWMRAIEAAGRTIIAPDLPGHGRDDVSRNPADYADLATLLEPCLPAGRFDAIGFSLGAKLLLELTLRHTERVGRLVLGGIGDNVFAPEAIAEAAARALESGPDADTPPPVRAFLSTWEPECNDALAIAAVLRRPPNPNFTPERLARVECPVLIVNGSEDPLGRASQRLRACLPAARSETLPGVGHFDLTAQRDFIFLALDFIDSHETAELQRR
jgi:pimeloyl-ACP methyl ester carboxylesterase